MTPKLFTALTALGLAAQVLPVGAQDAPPAPAQTPAQATGDEIVLSLPQMRVAAARAIQAGQYELAINMAHAMLLADPDDSYSHFIIAQAFLRNGQPEEARPAARL